MIEHIPNQEMKYYFPFLKGLPKFNKHFPGTTLSYLQNTKPIEPLTLIGGGEKNFLLNNIFTHTQKPKLPSYSHAFPSTDLQTSVPLLPLFT